LDWNAVWAPRFFKLIRIQHHVGVSEAALRRRMQQMELLLPQFQEACEQQVNKQKRKAVVAMDETFFGDFLILVLMDLSSGYLVSERKSRFSKFRIKKGDLFFKENFRAPRKTIIF
jgi:Zn-dependent peptidase ImmA (M78 family)